MKSLISNRAFLRVSRFPFFVFRFPLPHVFSLLVMSFSLFTAVSAQRDFLNDDEVELIRDAQAIDLRIDVLTHAIDRRFTVLKVDAGGTPINKKEIDSWGKMPAGTRLELLNDIRRILQKAIDDIDNLSERPTSMVIDPDAEKDKKKIKAFADVFPKAVRLLAAAAARYQPVLKAELDKTNDDLEKGSILASLEFCDQIIASVSKLSH